jgi:2-dehydro-3-deoxygluconokinase
VSYDRAGSSISTAKATDFDWNAIFDGADWFHISGVTPAISASAAELSLAAARAAREKGLTVSCDYNFRKNLWRYGKKAPEVMRELVACAHVGIANEEDCQKALGIEVDVDVKSGELGHEKYCALAKRVLAAFPNFGDRYHAARKPQRRSQRVERGPAQPSRFPLESQYEITDIVDRVGGGTRSPRVIYGLRAYGDDLRALDSRPRRPVSSTPSATSIA